MNQIASQLALARRDELLGQADDRRLRNETASRTRATPTKSMHRTLKLPLLRIRRPPRQA
jgi:hypothetical protein